MPFGLVGRMSPGMRQVVGFGDRFTGRSNFGGEYGALHCNHWEFCGRCHGLFPNYFGYLFIVCYYDYKDWNMFDNNNSEILQILQEGTRQP